MTYQTIISDLAGGPAVLILNQSNVTTSLCPALRRNLTLAMTHPAKIARSFVISGGGPRKTSRYPGTRSSRPGCLGVSGPNGGAPASCQP